MRTPSKRATLVPFRGVVAVGAAFSLVLGACSSGPKTTPTSRVPGVNYAGRVEGSNAFIGIALQSAGNRVIGYISDGVPDGPVTSLHTNAWFEGERVQNTILAASTTGDRLEGQFSGNALIGHVILADSRILFYQATKGTGDAGLYWEEDSVAGGPASRTGRIVLSDGQERGTAFEPYASCFAGPKSCR